MVNVMGLRHCKRVQINSTSAICQAASELSAGVAWLPCSAKEKRAASLGDPSAGG